MVCRGSTSRDGTDFETAWPVYSVDKRVASSRTSLCRNLCKDQVPLFVGLYRAYAERTQKSVDLSHSQKPPDPEYLAAVLMALGMLSKKDIESIQVIGRSTGGWLVAFAAWVLGLTAKKTSEEGEVLFSNCKSTEDAQVQLLVEGSAKNASRSLQLASRTYLLPDGWEELYIQDAVSNLGRVPWETCLTSTFGDSDLTSSFGPDFVGTLLGCVAGILKAVADESSDVHNSNTLCGLPASRNELFLPLYADYGKGVHAMDEHLADAIKSYFPK